MKLRDGVGREPSPDALRRTHRIGYANPHAVTRIGNGLQSRPAGKHHNNHERNEEDGGWMRQQHRRANGGLRFVDGRLGVVGNR